MDKVDDGSWMNFIKDKIYDGSCINYNIMMDDE